MAWNSTKAGSDLILSADWNAMTGVIMATSMNQSGTVMLGSGNTYFHIDAANNKIYLYIAGTKVAEWG